MDRFTKVYNEFYLHEINRPIIKSNYVLFNDLAKKLILEDYHIFPVPKLLLDDIEKFVKEILIKDLDATNKIIKKEYSFKELLEKYTKDWDYYQDFVKNVKELNKLNRNGKIICCVIIDENQIKNIISTYHLDVTFDQIKNSKACAINCNNTENFNVCLCINTINGEDSLRKCIQHELIHWMQISLNVYSKTTKGIFKNKEFNLNEKDLEQLSKIYHLSFENFIQTYEYLLNGYEFEAWVANTCEDFENSGLTIEEFKDIIENIEKFKNYYHFEIHGNENLREMILFGRICYLSSLNDKSDDRYWYLIEALKENKTI